MCHFLPSVHVGSFCLNPSAARVHHKDPCSTFHVFVRIMSEGTNVTTQRGAFVGVDAACRDAEQVLRSAGLRCGKKQTYRFSVRDYDLSLSPILIALL
jgi:hypothetical protein